MIKLEKKQLKKNWVNWINLSNSQPESWDGSNPIKSKSNVEGHETEITSYKKNKRNDLFNKG
jgi:hypothetical protein